MALATLAIAACGSGSDAGPGALQAAMTEFSFDPTAWTVTSGDEVTIELVNNGTAEHNWTLMKAGSEITSESDLPEDGAARAELYVAQGSATPGQTTTVTFTAPAAGEYQVICDIQAHFSAGMSGSLTVEG